jgi:hypothetical protein
LSCSRRFCCRSACNDPGPLNGFSFFTVFQLANRSTVGAKSRGNSAIT